MIRCSHASNHLSSASLPHRSVIVSAINLSAEQRIRGGARGPQRPGAASRAPRTIILLSRFARPPLTCLSFAAPFHRLIMPCLLSTSAP